MNVLIESGSGTLYFYPMEPDLKFFWKNLLNITSLINDTKGWTSVSSGFGRIHKVFLSSSLFICFQLSDDSCRVYSGMLPPVHFIVPANLNHVWVWADKNEGKISGLMSKGKRRHNIRTLPFNFWIMEEKRILPYCSQVVYNLVR